MTRRCFAVSETLSERKAGVPWASAPGSPRPLGPRTCNQAYRCSQPCPPTRWGRHVPACPPAPHLSTGGLHPPHLHCTPEKEQVGAAHSAHSPSPASPQLRVAANCAPLPGPFGCGTAPAHVRTPPQSRRTAPTAPQHSAPPRGRESSTLSLPQSACSGRRCCWLAQSLRV